MKDLQKCKESGQDPNMAKPCLRSTPLSHDLPSSAELLNGQVYQTNLPAVSKPSISGNGDINAYLIFSQFFRSEFPQDIPIADSTLQVDDHIECGESSKSDRTNRKNSMIKQPSYYSISSSQKTVFAFPTQSVVNRSQVLSSMWQMPHALTW